MASPRVDVYVKLPSGRTTTVAVMAADKVSKIYSCVGKEEGVPDSCVRLIYQGKVVDKTKTIGYLGIREETILKGEIIAPKALSLYLKFADGHTLSMTAQNSDKIVDIKQYILEKEGLCTSTSTITLRMSGRTLIAEYQMLCEVGIEDETILEVSVINTPRTAEKEHTRKEKVPEKLKKDVFASFNTEGKNVDVVFCFDTTGSMASFLHEVRTDIKDTCTRLLQDIPGIRIGIMAHGDYCDQATTYVVRSADLTTDIDQLVKFTSDTPATSGGDSPECYEWALRKAQQLDWSEDSAKAFVMIGDCEPHPPSYTDQNINWRDELNVLIGMGVKVYGVFCEEWYTEAKHFYAEIAEKSGGCLLKLAHFNLITEMFLAVCYKEASSEQLTAYTVELEKKGQLVGETKELMKQLDNKTCKKKAKITKKKNLGAAWWDVTLDNRTPVYTYDIVTDTWSVIEKTSDLFDIEKGAITPSTSRSMIKASSTLDISDSSLKRTKKRKRKRQCIIL